MTTTEYVNQIDRLMSLQNIYIGIFLAFLAIVIGVMGFLQWRLSDSQVEKFKSDTKEEISRKYKNDLDVAIKENKDYFLESVKVIVLSTIDTLVMTEMRINFLGKKIADLVTRIEDIDNLNNEEAKILIDSINYTMRVVRQGNLSTEETEIKKKCKEIYPYLVNVLNFIESKANKDYLNEYNFYSNTKEELKIFESEYIN